MAPHTLQAVNPWGLNRTNNVNETGSLKLGIVEAHSTRVDGSALERQNPNYVVARDKCSITLPVDRWSFAKGSTPRSAPFRSLKTNHLLWWKNASDNFDVKIWASFTREEKLCGTKWFCQEFTIVKQVLIATILSTWLSSTLLTSYHGEDP